MLIVLMGITMTFLSLSYIIIFSKFSIGEIEQTRFIITTIIYFILLFVTYLVRDK
jgi:hypothetical protein